LALQKVRGTPRGLVTSAPGPVAQHPITKLNIDVAFDHVRELVLVVVGMDGRAERSRGQQVLDQAEAAARLRAAEHEPHSQARPPHQLARPGRQDHGIRIHPPSR
jgi:hypothetical protein